VPFYRIPTPYMTPPEKSSKKRIYTPTRKIIKNLRHPKNQIKILSDPTRKNKGKNQLLIIKLFIMEITNQDLQEMKIIAENILQTVELIRKNNIIADDRSKKRNLRVVNSQCIELNQLNDSILSRDLSNLKL